MRIFAILLSTVFVSLSASADTYYDMLQKQFKVSSEAISATDILPYGHPLSPYCVEFAKDHPMDEIYVKIGRFTRSSDGPGPGLPPVDITKVIWTSGYQDLSFLFDSTQLDTSSRELRVTQTNPENLVLLLHKQKDLFYFKRTITWTETTKDPATDKDVTVTKTADHFGYCYPPPTAAAEEVIK